MAEPNHHMNQRAGSNRDGDEFGIEAGRGDQIEDGIGMGDGGDDDEMVWGDEAELMDTDREHYEVPLIHDSEPQRDEDQRNQSTERSTIKEEIRDDSAYNTSATRQDSSGVDIPSLYTELSDDLSEFSSELALVIDEAFRSGLDELEGDHSCEEFDSEERCVVACLTRRRATEEVGSQDDEDICEAIVKTVEGLESCVQNKEIKDGAKGFELIFVPKDPSPVEESQESDKEINHAGPGKDPVEEEPDMFQDSEKPQSLVEFVSFILEWEPKEFHDSSCVRNLKNKILSMFPRQGIKSIFNDETDYCHTFVPLVMLEFWQIVAYGMKNVHGSSKNVIIAGQEEGSPGLQDLQLIYYKDMNDITERFSFGFMVLIDIYGDDDDQSSNQFFGFIQSVDFGVFDRNHLSFKEHLLIDEPYDTLVQAAVTLTVRRLDCSLVGKRATIAAIAPVQHLICQAKALYSLDKMPHLLKHLPNPVLTSEVKGVGIELEEKDKRHYTKEQLEALQNMANVLFDNESSMFAIGGVLGSGKTTLMKQIVIQAFKLSPLIAEPFKPILIACSDNSKCVVVAKELDEYFKQNFRKQSISIFHINDETIPGVGIMPSMSTIKTEASEMILQKLDEFNKQRILKTAPSLEMDEDQFQALSRYYESLAESLLPGMSQINDAKFAVDRGRSVEQAKELFFKKADIIIGTPKAICNFSLMALSSGLNSIKILLIDDVEGLTEPEVCSLLSFNPKKVGLFGRIGRISNHWDDYVDSKGLHTPLLSRIHEINWPSSKTSKTYFMFERTPEDQKEYERHQVILAKQERQTNQRHENMAKIQQERDSRRFDPSPYYSPSEIAPSRNVYKKFSFDPQNPQATTAMRGVIAPHRKPSHHGGPKHSPRPNNTNSFSKPPWHSPASSSGFGLAPRAPHSFTPSRLDSPRGRGAGPSQSGRRGAYQTPPSRSRFPPSQNHPRTQ